MRETVTKTGMEVASTTTMKLAPRRPLLVTVDVEDQGSAGESPRFRDALQPLLTMLDQQETKATFFVVGELANSWADELRELSAAGHEIGLHGHTHEFLSDLGAAKMAVQLSHGREVLTDLVGTAPVGFRAPYFGLTRKTPWAPDVIKEAGFMYSSSVLPVWNPQAGYRGAPKRPFKWSNGLIEFPSPVLAIGSLGLPVLGGAYLRLVPSMVVNLAERVTRADGRWVYAHPYDFDIDEPFSRRPGQSLVVTKLLFARRALMLERVRRLSGPDVRTLAALAGDTEFTDKLRSFTPVGSGKSDPR